MENKTNWCVYMHENRENGKKYIGITSQKPTNRWNNGRGYNRSPLFYAAINKYGWDSFRHDILYTGLSQEEAERLEVEMIAKYQTTDPARGYNLAAGGGVNAGFHRTEEFKKKLSATRKARGIAAGANHPFYGKHRSEETREKIRAPQAGRPKCPESREKMRESAQRRWRSENQAEREYLRQLNLGGNSARARAVRCVETGEVFDAIRVAAEIKCADVGGIVKCCKGRRQTAGGYHWEYADEAVTANG